MRVRRLDRRRHLYLEVRKLLQDKVDQAITKDDYIAIVGRFVEDFYAGVTTNIRTRIAAEWLTNLKMIFLPGYSRTMRAGELYEKEIYAKVDDGLGDRPRWLNELRIEPPGQADFSPKDDTLLDLYEPMPPPAEERPVVRRSDGGVFDNQGISALLEQGCSVLLVSDASGQMADLDFPSNSALGVPLRANGILQARVRVAQFEDLDSRKRGALLKGLMFIHLKKDLDSTEVDWIDCQEPSGQKQPKRPLTEYGVQHHVQRQLGAVRTDLDSFSEAEAYALMTSGYLMTGQALAEKGVLGFSIEPSSEQQWKFLAIKPLMQQAGGHTPLLRQLRVAHTRLFKVWYLTRYLQILAGFLALVLLFLLGYAAYQWWSNRIIELTVGGAILGLLMIVLSLAGLGLLTKLINYKKTAAEILIGIGMATFGFLVARLHLHVFDKLFLKQGSLKSLLGK